MVLGRSAVQRLRARALEPDGLGSDSSCVAYLLCDLGQVTQPLFGLVGSSLEAGQTGSWEDK